MSILVLVRHGQASFFDDDYDQLSPAGMAQAAALGDDWARRRERFDDVYVGPRRRQRQTAEIVRAHYHSLGLPWPEPVGLAELDEYDLAGIVDRLAPALARQDRAFEEQLKAYQHGADDLERVIRFQRMFETLLVHWLRLPEAAEGVEPWPLFRDRVRRAVQWMTDRPGRGRRVAAFTSGGVIGTVVGLALAAPDRSVLELSWRLRNCSQTRLLFTSGRLTLDEFNSVCHLHDPALWTYR